MPTKLHDDFKQHKQRGSLILVKIVLSEDKKFLFLPGAQKKLGTNLEEKMHSKVIQNTFPTCPQDCNEAKEDGGRWAVAEQCL